MRDNRRSFLKRGGVAGITVAGVTILPACRSESGETSTPDERWQTDPKWQEVKYGAWRGPGVPIGAGPMDGVLLKDYAPRSSVVTDETFVPKASYPVVDVHVHHYPARAQGKSAEVTLAEWVKTQDEVGIQTSVVLTGATGSDFDRLLKMYLEPYPDRFQLYCGLEVTDIGKPDYPDRVVVELERCYRNGARGVGEITDKGYGLTRDSDLPPGERLHHDDPRLGGVWNMCAELNLPVNIHIADHLSAWEPPDVFQERTPVFQQFNQAGEDALSYEGLLAILPRLLEKHPKTTFIACHLANQGNDLARLGRLLHQYPNLNLDISARDYEIGRTPRAAATFLTKYADRVLFGTDMGMEKTMYQSWWRLLETADEYMVGRVWWPYYGLELSGTVLESLYVRNAKRILNWENV
ncbi:MAG: amidohydrolase family protein [Luteitalea sp.]|nr:amidohydrolase family protein [Luteitalea sp.]